MCRPLAGQCVRHLPALVSCFSALSEYWILTVVLAVGLIYVQSKVEVVTMNAMKTTRHRR
jgi:hypothetical protein